QVVVAAQVARASFAVGVTLVRIAAAVEALAAIAVLIQRVRLQHRAHRTIQHQDALAERLLQSGDAVGVQPGENVHAGFLANRPKTSKCGGRASRDAFAQCSTSSPALRANAINSSRLKPRLR